MYYVAPARLVAPVDPKTLKLLALLAVWLRRSGAVAR